MKMIIPLLCILPFTIAEPPVGDSYASPRSNQGYDYDFQRSSQHYGPPPQISTGRNSLSSEYGIPKARSSNRPPSTYGLPTSQISEEYGVPRIQEYAVQAGRNNPPQDYGVPKARNAFSVEYGEPSQKALTQQYDVPIKKNVPSQKYGAPKSGNALSQNIIPKPFEEYDISSARYSPSQGYGSHSQDYKIPSPKQSSSYLSRNIESSILSNLYGTPGISSEDYKEYGSHTSKSSSHLSRNIEAAPSSVYGVPRSLSKESGSLKAITKSQPSSLYLPQKSSFSELSSKSLSKSREDISSYGAPKIDSLTYGVPKSLTDYSQGLNDFGARASDAYQVPSRSFSQEYGAPSTSSLKTNAVASSYSSARSSLSSTYGVPSTRGAVPSDEYGVPKQYNAKSSQGYEYGRSTDEDFQDPASYGFAYKVNDYISGSDFGHTESRQDNKAQGTYFVVLPDGNKQVVEYEADERGFKPRISVEPAVKAGGYDDSAADIIESSGGPY